MGCCHCSCQSSTTAGSRILLPQVTWDGGFDAMCNGLEVGGIPLYHYLANYSDLSLEEQEEVQDTVVAEVNQTRATSSQGVASMSPSRTRDVWLPGLPRSISTGRLGICHLKPVRVGVLSWNVGGMSDNRKDHGAGIEKRNRGDVVKVLSAAVRDMGAAEVIVVGLQETISLTPGNAMKAMSSAGDSRRNRQGYSWPETVAQWVELLVTGLNTRPGNEDGGTECRAQQSNGSEERSSRLGDRGAYALFGNPVYLFGMLMCVFCRTEVLKHIKDFCMVEKAMDRRFHSGAKGVVACRFVLFDRSFCFINCHLSAEKRSGLKYRLKSFEKRVRQIQKIWTEVQFKSHVDQMVYPVSAHRATFLLGDTNFRNWVQANKDIPVAGEEAAAAQGVAPATENYADLWAQDQLFQELHRTARVSESSQGNKNSAAPPTPGSVRQGVLTPSTPSKSSSGPQLTKISALLNDSKRALLLWREPVITENAGPPFPPTFKLAVPGPGYSRKRIPAWTDRVLFRSQHAEPLSYGSVQQEKVLKPPRNVSDHDPVFARFEVGCVTVNSRKLGQLIRDVRQTPLGPESTDAGRQRLIEQALAFQANVVEAAQPEVEDLARRLFAGLQDLGGPEAALAASTQLLECQEECWHLATSQMESQIMRSLRRRVASEGELSGDAANAAVKEALAAMRTRGEPLMVSV